MMKLACVQADVVFGRPEANLAVALGHLESLKKQAVEFVVFPEAFLTGYCVDCPEDAQSIALDQTGGRVHPVVQRMADECERLDILCVVGFAERDEFGVRNTAALLEPGLPPRFYRKVHLPFLGLDRFVVAGQELPLFETRFGVVAMLICFDLRFPEPSRVMALAGADIIVLPTNWPEGAEVSAEHIAVARAAENRVFVATCNRTGTESGFRFIGLSKIVGPSGQILAAAGAREEVIIAEVQLHESRRKRTITIAGKYETETFLARAPALYGNLAACSSDAANS